MKTKILLSAGLLTSTMILAATSGAMAQNKPLKLGAILDMSGLYADITGPGRIVLERMPSAANWMAIDLERRISAALEAP